MTNSFYKKAKTIEEIKRMLHLSAAVYSNVCNKQVLFIYRKNSKNEEYKYYETYFGKENYIHLVGCCSNKFITAEQFYDKCLETDDIPIEYITYKESRLATSNKLEVFTSLFKFPYIKLYKIGKHDKINEKNNFQIGIGNSMSNGVLGFTKYNKLPVPTTILVNSLSEYTTSEENVLAILCKSSKKYDTIIGCIKSGLLIEDLPKSLQNKLGFPKDIKKICSNL